MAFGSNTLMYIVACIEHNWHKGQQLVLFLVSPFTLPSLGTVNFNYATLEFDVENKAKWL